MQMEMLALAILAVAGWFWFDSMRAREAAVRLGRQTCQREGVQFLDDTVALAKFALGRNRKGHAALQRTYRFEFSPAGNERLAGQVVLIGGQVEAINLAPHQKGAAYADPTGSVSCCGGGCHSSSAPVCDEPRCG
ncbi:MAG: DUF3301 domain-containing protein [Pseudomonadota bacterium]